MRGRRRCVVLGIALLGSLGMGGAEASAQRMGAGRRYVVARPQPVDPTNPAPSRGLGTFYANPQAWVGGSFPVGPGYTPMDSQNAQSLSVYGPLSGLRAATVTVPSYNRGYDGRLYPSRAVTFAYPNAPELSPYIYPNPRTYVPGVPTPTVPPWRLNAINNWIDQN